MGTISCGPAGSQEPTLENDRELIRGIYQDSIRRRFRIVPKLKRNDITLRLDLNEPTLNDEDDT